MNLRKFIKLKLKIMKLKKNKILIGKNTEIRKSVFEGQNILEENIKFNKSYLGFGSTINSNSDLENVKIGKNVTFLSGIKIGDGAIIAAGAVVVKDVESFSIVGGVPAKEIRKKFAKEEILFLMEFKWWDKPLEWIKENVELFSDIKKFMSIYKNNTNDGSLN